MSCRARWCEPIKPHFPLCAHLGLEPEFDDDLKEAGWQAGAYMRSEENMQHFVDRIAANPDFLYAPEGRAAFTERVTRSFHKVAVGNPGRTVAVFCHGMVTSTIAGHALGIAPGPDTLTPHYSSLTRIQASSTGEHWTLRSFNESMHLRGV